MKVYLAAGFSRKQEIADKTKELESIGIRVTSTWPTENAAPNCELHQFTDDYHAEMASRDVDEIRQADALVLFTHDPNIPFKRGGRMHEAGFAHALGKRLYVCGPKENIFHYLPEIEQYDSWDTLKAVLAMTTV